MDFFVDHDLFSSIVIFYIINYSTVKEKSGKNIKNYSHNRKDEKFVFFSIGMKFSIFG